MAERICFVGRGGCGKSLLAANLSHALARMGYKVLLVGNDTGEDLAPALQIGLPCYLVTDCIIDRGGVPLETPRGTFRELLDYLKEWPGHS